MTTTNLQNKTDLWKQFEKNHTIKVRKNAYSWYIKQVGIYKVDQLYMKRLCTISWNRGIIVKFSMEQKVATSFRDATFCAILLMDTNYTYMK